eukprot:12092620-Alexandrium_andersonii.AAC.1
MRPAGQGHRPDGVEKPRRQQPAMVHHASLRQTAQSVKLEVRYQITVVNRLAVVSEDCHAPQEAGAA